MQDKIPQTSGANSDHKHSEIEHFSMLNERILRIQSHNRQNSKDSVIVDKFSDLH